MKNVKSFFKRLWKEESGQGATEYILLLVVVVAVAMLFRDQIQEAVNDRLGQLRGQLDSFSSVGQ